MEAPPHRSTGLWITAGRRSPLTGRPPRINRATGERPPTVFRAPAGPIQGPDAGFLVAMTPLPAAVIPCLSLFWKNALRNVAEWLGFGRRI